jgi:hypothetical protein
VMWPEPSSPRSSTATTIIMNRGNEHTRIRRLVIIREGNGCSDACKLSFGLPAVCVY